jgi:hypothetical protein
MTTDGLTHTETLDPRGGGQGLTYRFLHAMQARSVVAATQPHTFEASTDRGPTPPPPAQVEAWKRPELADLQPVMRGIESACKGIATLVRRAQCDEISGVCVCVSVRYGGLVAALGGVVVSGWVGGWLIGGVAAGQHGKEGETNVQGEVQKVGVQSPRLSVPVYCAPWVLPHTHTYTHSYHTLVAHTLTLTHCR